MQESYDILKEKLAAFKRKYYLNQLIKNAIIFVSIILSIFFLVNSVEFTFNLNSGSRLILFYGTLASLGFSIYKWLYIPFVHLIRSNESLSDEEAAQQIGNYFPDLGDKLLNTIQLTKLSQQNELIAASIEQRSEKISLISFNQSINLKENNRYVKYAIVPALVIVIILIFIPQYFTESTTRIVNYDKEFETPRLFRFVVDESSLTVFKNEDLNFEFQIEGSAIPKNIYVLANGRRHKMMEDKNRKASYVFSKVQKSFPLTIIAADYKSKTYTVEAISRPEIQAFNVQLKYPRYTRLKSETLSNVGNITVPEGTMVQWDIQTLNTNSLDLYFSNQLFETQNADNQVFHFQKKASQSEEYQLSLQNEFGHNKDSIVYTLTVQEDESPRLSMDYFQDTTLYSYVVFNGLISDDYGISNLELVFERNNETERLGLPFSSKLVSQNFFYQWSLDSLKLREGEDIEFFVRVWDNDGVNGRKSTQSPRFKLSVPNKKEINEKIDKQSAAAKNELDRTLKESQDLNHQIQEIQDELKRKKELDWKDNKRMKDLVEQKKELEKDIEELAEKHRDLMEKREHFNQPNPKLQEKARQLQDLMNEVLDEETKALYDELQKLLEENTDQEEIQNMMDQIQKKEGNMEKELERAIEMFKRMQFDFKMDEIINDLDQLEKKQMESSEDTKSKSSDLEKSIEDQKQQMEEFEDLKEDLDKLNELNDQMKTPEELESLEQEKEEIESEMQESLEQLEQKNRKKASQSQQNSSTQMQKMKKKMQDMQASMEMQMLQENLENLRDIVDNLVKLSFDQEQIMNDFNGVNQSDPRYVTLSQSQLKLRDDAVIIEDSLLSLANRVFQIKSFVTRELDDMNDNIESSLQALKDRHKNQAVSYQQYAMTSINNLALLLDDVLQQMMQQMADAMGTPQKGDKNGKQQTPALSKLQEQLNKQIEDLQKSGKSGRQLSQELAQLAAEQEMLRQQLQKMEQEMGQENEDAKNGLSEAIKKMEQTENELVYKKLNRQTINRQKEILTRMLEAENSMMERELDKKRKGEEAKEISKTVPPAFEEYFKAKEKELELLHSIPSKMSPYYKEEVNKYFKRLNEE